MQIDKFHTIVDTCKFHNMVFKVDFRINIMTKEMLNMHVTALYDLLALS